MNITAMVQYAIKVAGGNQTTTGEKLGYNKSNFSRLLSKNNNLRVRELEEIGNTLGYDLSIAFVDRETGKRIEA